MNEAYLGKVLNPLHFFVRHPRFASPARGYCHDSSRKSISKIGQLKYYSTTLARKIESVSVSESVVMSKPGRPDSFFAVRFQLLDQSPGLTAVCAGYELKEWRKSQLAGHLIKWLPEFALTYSELTSLGAFYLSFIRRHNTTFSAVVQLTKNPAPPKPRAAVATRV